MNLVKIEQRAIIKFLTSEKCEATEIHERLVKYSSDSAPSLETVRRWRLMFVRGRTSLEDDERPGRPISVSHEENVQKLLEIVRQDRRMKLSELAHIMKISKGTVHSILTQTLGMRKISARWVPKILSVSEKQKRVQFCQENLDFISDEPNFFTTLVTGDETWCYYYDPETKTQSMQWKHPDSPGVVKGKREKSTKKLMATVFWDCEGILLIEYMPHGRSITGLSYAETLKNLKQAIRQKRGKQARKKVRILHDNASSHTSLVARDALLQSGFEEMFHPPYSPDLAPSDYYLFRNLKNHLKGKRYASDEEVKETVKSYFEGLPETFYKTGLESLKLKWEKCVQLRGEYIEKQ